MIAIPFTKYRIWDCYSIVAALIFRPHSFDPTVYCSNVLLLAHCLNATLKIDHRNAQRNHWYGRVEGTPTVPKWGIRSESHRGNQKFWAFICILINRFGHIGLVWQLRSQNFKFLRFCSNFPWSCHLVVIDHTKNFSPLALPIHELCTIYYFAY